MSLENNRERVGLNHSELSKRLKSIYDTNINSSDLKKIERKKATNSTKDKEMLSEFFNTTKSDVL